MILKGIFAQKPAIYHLLVLLILVFGGAIFASLLSTGIILVSHGLNTNLFQYPDTLRWIQLLSSVFTFLIPAVLMAYLCSNNLKEYLSIKSFPALNVLLLSFLGLIFLSPLINLTEFFNKQIVLPTFLEPLESWMQAQENTASRLTEVLLSDKSISKLLINLLIIAVAAGVTEEFLFRGALQRTIGQFTQNHHLVIWIAAFLFSAFHLQFYGFIPRMILGAYFGYLLYWSRNIWIPVLVHFLNNSIAVLGMSSDKLKDNQFFTGDLSDEQILPYALASVIFLFIFMLIAKRLRRLGVKDLSFSE